MENSELKEQSRHSFRLWAEFRAFMRDRFSLEDDKASQDEVAANISKGTEFRGVNLWVLICATMVASLGLNVNSAAVIIGAMCISPIMGPIMGIGFSLGINDFDLLKKSVRNFVLMFVVAISTSTEGKISNESPVGKALIGAHTGDVVEVEMPAGIMKYKVLEIQRNV